jgi:hypothetical protein
MAPATHVWQGAISSNWSDPGNWKSGGSPYGDSAAEVIFGGDSVGLQLPGAGSVDHCLSLARTSS